jgi:hypothetical protein
MPANLRQANASTLPTVVAKQEKALSSLVSLVRIDFGVDDHFTLGAPPTSTITFSIVPVKVNGGS